MLFGLLVLVAYIHTGLGEICRIYSDPFLRPFNRNEDFALNRDVLPLGVYSLMERQSDSGRLPLVVQVDIGHPYMMSGYGCGWSPNAVTLNFSDFGMTFTLSKNGDAYRYVRGNAEPTVVSLPHRETLTTVGHEAPVSSEVHIYKSGDDLILSAKFPWELLIKIRGVQFSSHVWGKIVISAPRLVAAEGWNGLCYIREIDELPTTCGGTANNRRSKRESGGLKSPRKADIQRWRIEGKHSDNSKRRRSLTQLPTIYTYAPGTNVTETIEIHTRTRRYVHAINVDQSVISRVCNKVKDPSGPFAVCVSSQAFNAENQFLVCEAMLNGMGTDQPTTCVVLAQIAANCQDVIYGFSDVVWRSLVNC